MLLLRYGRGHRTAAPHIKKLIENVPGELATYRPRLSYLLIDEERYPEAHERRCTMSRRRCSAWRTAAPPQTCSAWWRPWWPGSTSRRTRVCGGLSPSGCAVCYYRRGSQRCLLDIIGFNQSGSSSAHRMWEADDDNSHGD